MQLAGAAVAVAALATMLAVGPPGTDAARAATNNYNQITGSGSTDSAVTVPWTKGLLDASNQPIANDSTDLATNADRQNGTGSLSFMYGDFENLAVTVSQTQDITQQGITVSWTGGEQTIGSGSDVQGNFLQLMECYGDASTGPNPEDCEYGSSGLAAANNASSNQFLGSRTGYICAGGLPPVFGCDPNEPGNANPPHIAPTGQGRGTFTVPFVPASNPSTPAYTATDQTQYYNEFNTDEIQVAITGKDGTGQVQFETLTGTGAPGLGCGQLEADGQPRGCWLVIVPRGQFEPNGYQIGTGAYLESSPLAASNWAQRIQVHLGFETLPQFCPIGANEIETVGTQVAARAVQSWQLALNTQADCGQIYGYSAVPESVSTEELADPTNSGIGLAFTTIPIGSEAARDGTPATPLPSILYAPVAVSAVAFGFNISQPNGYVSTPIKLTPQLLAEALTQVYRTDLPDFSPAASGSNNTTDPGPAWSQSNAKNITQDSQFDTLNPEVQQYNLSNAPLAPLLTEDHSALNQSVWEWIQADKATDGWLDGSAVPGTQTADPCYVTQTTTPNVPCAAQGAALDFGKAPALDSFPRAYSGCLDDGLSQVSGELPKEELKCSLDQLPFTNTYAAAAQAVLSANNSSATVWDMNAIAPDGTAGWWDKLGVEQLGETFMWALSDTPDLAQDGLIDAALCDSAGSSCVGPSVDSLTTALNSAKTDSAGLLEVNPASPGAGGYPLTTVIYAAVPTNQSPAALQDYAALIQYAAGAGQTPGVAPGDLPPGYLPLPASLQKQANDVANELLATATSQSASAGGTPTTAAPLPNNAGSNAPAPSLGGGLSAGQSGPAASGSPSSETGIRGPAAELAAIRTQRQPVGVIRWALLAIAIVGAACATGGTMLRSARVPHWLHRLRP